MTAILGLLLAVAISADPPPPPDALKLQTARNVGLAALEEGNLAEAAAQFETVRQLAPSEPLGWSNGAVAAMRAKDDAQAARLLAQALKLAPGDARVLALEGARRELAGDRAGAIESYEKAAALSPRDVASLWNAARLQAEMGEASRRGAIRDLEAALVQAPTNVFLLVRVAESYRADGDTARAIAASDRLAALVAGEAKLDQALAEGRLALGAGDARAASLRYKVAENILRTTPRYQAARHDVDVGVVGLPIEDWSAALAAALRARAALPVPVAYVRKPDPGLKAFAGAAAVRVGGKDARDLVVAGSQGLRVAAASPSGYRVGAAIAGSAAEDLAVADVTNSGSLDFITPGALWIRDGDGYRRVAMASGDRVVPFDVDADGDLDLYVSSKSGDRLLRNNLDGTWTDVTAAAGIAPGTVSRFAVAADFDRDGDVDLLLARPEGGFTLYDNLRGGRLAARDAGLPTAGVILAAAAGDLNGDGRVDLVWTTESGAVASLNRGDGFFGAGRAVGPGTVPLLFDYDNDGFLDLFLGSANGPSTLYRNDGTGTFGAAGVGALPAARAAEAVDADGDGDLDLVLVLPDGSVALFENRGGNANGWIDVALEGLPTGSAKVNRFGYGSEVEARAQDLYVYRVAARPVTRVGLGARRRADVVRIVWSNGVPQNALDPPVKTVLREVQQLKGSCPFLYAFDGARWHFVTDVLGRAPAGLLFDGIHQAAADTREWLVVPGDWLKPSGGALTLDFTEELWEAAYFDLAELSAVDHPAGVALVSNEKMVPPPFPSKEIFTVSRPLTPRAVDGDGRDRTAEIAAEDGVYVAGFAPTALPGARRAARARARPVRGAAGQDDHALSHGVDLLRRHLDQRLPRAAKGRRGHGARARGPGRKGRLEDRDSLDGVPGGQDEDDAGGSVRRARSRGPARADPDQPRDLLGPDLLHGGRGSGPDAPDRAAAFLRRALLPRVLADAAREPRRPAGLRPRRRVAAAALGRHGRALHPLRRRGRAARGRGRPLRDHEGRRRRAAALRCAARCRPCRRAGCATT